MRWKTWLALVFAFAGYSFLLLFFAGDFGYTKGFHDGAYGTCTYIETDLHKNLDCPYFVSVPMGKWEWKK